MKSKVVNRIPGKKAKELIMEKKPLNTPEEIETPDKNLPKTLPLDDRKMLDDKNRKSEARREFEAAIRGKLKNSRKR
jgi:hypothetical protein